MNNAPRKDLVQWGRIELNVNDYGSNGTDLVDDSVAITNAVTDSVANGGRIVFLPGTYKVSDDIDISCTAKFYDGAMLSVDSGKMVTITGNIEAGLHQIFTGAGTISFTGNRKLKEAYPQWWGATGDDSTDDYSAINACLTACAGICPVYFSKGTYLVGTTLDPPSNTTIIGASRDDVIIREHSGLGNARLFYVQGTALAHKSNFVIKHLTIRNGTATVDAGNYQIGLDFIYCDNITIEDCYFTEIRGIWAILTNYVTNAKIHKNKVYRFNYGGIFVGLETSECYVTENYVDTAVGTGANSYGIATGSGLASTGTFGCKNVWILNNIVKNIPYWEGIDTHGGQNIWIQDNYVENAKIGVAIDNEQSAWTDNKVLKNVYVGKNTLLQGTGNANGYGVVVTGQDWNTVEHIVIRENKIVGFGSTAGGASSIVAPITIYNVNDVAIENNDISEFNVVGITLYYNCNDIKITDNKIKNAVSKDTYSLSYGIKCVVHGIYNTFIDHNKIWYDDVSKTIDRGITAGDTGNIILGQHNVVDVTTLPISGLNTGYAGDPTSKYWRQGDIAYTSNLIPLRGVNAGFGVFGWTTKSLLVNATATEYTATLTTPADYWELPPMANVVITGADTAGGDLTTVILKVNIDGTLELRDAIVTTVTGAAITMVVPTFTAY